MTLGGDARRVLLLIAAGLIVVGVALLALAWATPWHTDETAYAAALDALRQSVGSDPTPVDHAAATVQFHLLQDQYRTPKWTYADAGYTFLAWAVVIVLAMRSRRRMGASAWSTRRPLLVTLPTVLGLGLLLFGLIMSVWQPEQRQQLPDWHDGGQASMFGAFAFVAVIAPFLLAFVLTPVFLTRREPGPPWILRGAQGWAVNALVSAVYALPILGILVLASSAFQPGGWAASSGAAILLWALLNARAIWLGARIEAA